MVAHACNPSYEGSITRRIEALAKTGELIRKMTKVKKTRVCLQ
jgi:hypothetical protein